MSPRKPRKPCKHPRCPKLTEETYCEEHERTYSSERESASSRGYNSTWRIARDRFLKANPLCVHCIKVNKIVKATVIDHIVPHRGNKNLLWDENNWQALCKKCHDKKTGTMVQHKEYMY